MLLHRTQILDGHSHDDDYHMTVKLWALMLLAIAALSIFGRILTKIAVLNRLALDDYTALSALASYAASLLYIATIVLTKISVILFIRSLVPVRVHKYIGIVFIFGVSLWGIGSEIVAVFERQKSNEPPFNAPTNRQAFWSSFHFLNIFIDGLLVTWPSIIVYNLDAKLSHRLAIMSYFACRLLAIGAVIAQIVVENHITDTSDPSFNLWPSTVCAQVVQALSIVTGCIPYLKSCLRNFYSGQSRNANIRFFHSRVFASRVYSAGIEANPQSSVPTSVSLQNWNHTGYITKVEGTQGNTESRISRVRVIKCITSWEVDTQPRDH